MYKKGEDVEKDYDKAFECYKSSVKGEYPKAISEFENDNIDDQNKWVEEAITKKHIFKNIMNMSILVILN